MTDDEWEAMVADETDPVNEELDRLRNGSLQLSEETKRERIARLDRGCCPIHDMPMEAFTKPTRRGWFYVQCPVCAVEAIAGSNEGPYELIQTCQALVGRDFFHPSAILTDEAIRDYEQEMGCSD